MKKSFIFFFIIIGNLSFAQDTIFTRESKTIIVKVLEIQAEAIRYKIYTFQDGPDYILEKDKIAAIHYAQGIKQSFEQKATSEVIKPKKKQPGSNDYYVPQNTMQEVPIFRLANKFMINGIPSGENQLYAKVLSVGNTKIGEEVKYAKKARGLQYIGFAAIPLGYICLVGLASGLDGSSSNTSSSSNNNNSNYDREANIILGTIGCIGAIATTVISVYYKSERKAANERIIRLYNQRFQ